MTEGTQIFLLPISTLESTKETMPPAAPKAQDTHQLSDKLLIEKQQEEAEWESVNGLLMTHGFKPLCLVKRTDLKELIVFDKQSSQRMRQTLKMLIEETTRQQSMIRDLIETNQQLKSELQLEQNRATHQEQRANDLEQIMDSVKSKIGELEDQSISRVFQQQQRMQDLQKEHKVLQMKCQHYKKKRMEQEETIASLQKDIYRLTQEEEERIITQNRVFAYLCKRVPHTVLDKQLLCLIDYYESKLRKLHTQRQSKEDDSQSEEETNHRNLDASPSYKGLLMSLQNQLKEAKFKIDVLLGEKLNLQKDLESRPTEHELRLYKQQVKKLEKALKKNIKLQALTGQKKTDYTEKKDEPSKDSHQQVLVDQRYFQVLCSINSIIHNPRTPVIIYKQRKGGAQNLNKDTVQDCGFEHLIPIIETWADELTSLKSSNMLNFQTLQAIVSHFQKLFDVHSLNGVYPRMNEVYTRLGEMNNAVRNLQELLELDSSSSLCVVVSTVGKLCKIINEDVNDQVKQVLGPEDLQSIINKLEEHEEFFPAFQAFTSDLLEILEIDDLDAIVPAVKKLKVLSY
ncbi:centrosomal protein of 70 kDa isoform X3 [Cricetulus griseus]|uniref:Centrosomal protein of 70 kDa n=1 Tax=Cricetulus griseus TaxID=10029 RepID=A0A9J7FWX3_CRIGR|nr:centrosomal protein of 70 kDa isoform X3 [Cricetulus griseus]XP_027270065.1 centrosomal protein of 70 kDa isoform X3 [Cricetulus griseus]